VNETRLHRSLGEAEEDEDVMDRRLTVTLDTSTLPLERALRALGSLQADVKITTVTAREVGSKWEVELSQLNVLPETWVMGESPMGVGVIGSRADADLFEKTLAAISNGSFPERGARGHLTDGEQRQKLDALIFCTHVREKRDVFVTDDVKAFGGENTAQRDRIEALASTRVMTLSEFERFCQRERKGKTSS
jgi:hypothetical protein